MALELPGGVWRGVAPLAAPAPAVAAVEFWDAFKLLLMFFTAVHSRGQNYGGGLARRPSFLSHRLSYGKVSAKAPHGFWMSSCLGPTSQARKAQRGASLKPAIGIRDWNQLFFGTQLPTDYYYVARTKCHDFMANDVLIQYETTNLKRSG